MNANDANELNKWIENSPYTEQEEVIVLLRQQQARIKQLEEPETPCEELRRLQNEENNEPVVWLVQYTDRYVFRWSKPEHLFEALACEPLYTHPVKDLTNDEILEVAKKMGWRGALGFLINFARAILRKASEK